MPLRSEGAAEGLLVTQLVRNFEQQQFMTMYATRAIFVSRSTEP